MGVIASYSFFLSSLLVVFYVVSVCCRTKKDGYDLIIYRFVALFAFFSLECNSGAKSENFDNRTVSGRNSLEMCVQKNN